ncbi:hypothetical protein LBMAG56_09600 [Verrucomicrobiota bacterium]|nr:hypothetical protein LBMAG56_09600 [Verrucomicrobiota bacterium]
METTPTAPPTAPPNAPADAPLIELIDAAVFSVGVPNLVTVEGVNWRIRAEDFWVVAGLHGSGKSDLLATAAGLQPPERGRQMMFGQETAKLGESDLLAHRLKVGVVFEHGGRLFNQLTLAQNIGLPLCYHHNRAEAEAAETVTAMLKWIGLAAAADSLPGRVSRQARQRTALARALVLRPEILLLDNPLHGMDPRETRWWIEMLGRLAVGHPDVGGRRVTLVVTTEDLRPWLKLGRQFGCLNQRAWQGLGDREQVVASDDPFVRDLLLA